MNCNGKHYIRNRKTWEDCPNRDRCAAYDPSVEGNRYRYVADFRRCSPVVAKPERKWESSVVAEMTTPEKQAQAYVRACRENEKVMNYVTYTELLAIEVLNDAMEEIGVYMERDGVCRMAVKKRLAAVQSVFGRYMRKIKDNCYIGDREFVRDEADAMRVDYFKLFISVKQVMDKYREPHASSMASVLSCIALADLVNAMHDHRTEHMKKLDANLRFASFMRCTEIVSPLKTLYRELEKMSPNREDVIDLNRDMNIVNGVKVLNMRLQNPDAVNRILMKVLEMERKEKEK